jgi:hypothetical protein
MNKCSEFVSTSNRIFRRLSNKGFATRRNGRQDARFYFQSRARPVNEGDPYVVFTFWNSRQDFLNWVRSDEFVKGHAQSAPCQRTRSLKQMFWRCMRSFRIRLGRSWNPSRAAVNSGCISLECADLSAPSSGATCRGHCKLNQLCETWRQAATDQALTGQRTPRTRA